jgi:hypothetical protein
LQDILLKRLKPKAGKILASKHPILTDLEPILAEKVVAVNMIQVPEDHMKEMDDLRAENKRLREGLDHREYQVNQLEEIFHDSTLQLNSKNKLIEKLRRTLKQVFDMIENGYDPVNILAQIDWHIEE